LLQYTPSSSTSILRTISGRFSASSAVKLVPLSAPNCGIMAQVPRGLGPRGSIFSMCTAMTSPFCAPSTRMGPFCGFTKGMVSTREGRSCSLFTLPSKASRVSTTTRSPGLTVSTGSEYGPMV